MYNFFISKLSNLAQFQTLYGPPIKVQPEYGIPFDSPSPLAAFLSLITTPILIIFSFIIGTVLYLITHRKIFIVIPLFFSLLYLIDLFLSKLAGINLF